MWNAELKKIKHPAHPFFMERGFLIGLGIISIVASVLILGFSLYEGLLNGGRIRVLELPGFHELKLDTAGLYAGVYQHRGNGPLPLKELTQMDVRVMSKEDYEEVPVMMNTTGQAFHQFGLRGLPLFNFAIQTPGTYTLSGVYTAGENGPKVSVLLFPQAAQNVKQTLFVGITSFLFFLILGVGMLVKTSKKKGVAV